MAAKPETVDGPRAGEVGSERGSERGREKEPPPLVRVASASRMWLERHAWQECALVYESREYTVREYTVYDGLGAWVCSQLEPHPTRSEPSSEPS